MCKHRVRQAVLHHTEEEHWAVCKIVKLVAILEFNNVLKHIVEEKSHPGIKSSLRHKVL